MSTIHKDCPVLAVTAGWLALVIGGTVCLSAYANRGANLNDAPTDLPDRLNDLAATRDREFLLFVFAHPKCPCTRSTISELARLMVNCNGRLETHVLFFHPTNKCPAWSETDLWNSAKLIPGVTVSKDPDGGIAQQVGAAISGHTLLYDSAGALRFQGGITSSRGHEGQSRGRIAITKLVCGRVERQNPIVDAPTFGCDIFSDSESLTSSGEAQ